MSLRSRLGQLLRPVFRAFARRLPAVDPWARLGTGAPLHEFGPSATRPLVEYLRAETHVRTASINEIKDWLLASTYQPAGREGAAPVWPSLVEFERVRAGDCTGFAPWAWRKLVDLGVDATLVVGSRPGIDPAGERHLWVLFRTEEGEYVFEPTARASERMVRAKTDPVVRDGYRPEAGVSRDGQQFYFAGAALASRDRLERKDPSACTA